MVLTLARVRQYGVTGCYLETRASKLEARRFMPLHMSGPLTFTKRCRGCCIALATAS